jgi:hypothetical protein
MHKRKIIVPQKRYAHPDYLRELCNRIERCYFSEDRDWSCIEAIFKTDIKAMEQRAPKPERQRIDIDPDLLAAARKYVKQQLAIMGNPDLDADRVEEMVYESAKYPQEIRNLDAKAALKRKRPA